LADQTLPLLFFAARALDVHCDTNEDRETDRLRDVPWPISASFPALGKPAMEFTDRVLTCVDCGAEFVFTAGEQLFFHDKQFMNDPKRCKQCKAKRSTGTSRVRSETRTTCSECGESTTVPFKPTQGRPVLCRSCFQKQLSRTPAPQPAPMVHGPTAMPS
jgi:CxxC-x17-CxxC domain-containing protein